MNVIKKIIRRLIYKENASSKALIKYLRERGAEIGNFVTIYAPNKTLIDKQNPYLLKIGDHVRITEGVKILTHDYSWSVLKRYSSESIMPGAVFGKQVPVRIGNNVFIGMNSIITCGAKIGNNVIVGAGSVVTGDLDSDGVYAGVPAKRIMSIEEFYQKRKNAQFAEAREIAIRYRSRFGVVPDRTVFSEYFMLFASKEEADGIGVYKKHMEAAMNYDECAAWMIKNEPMFASYEDFLHACYEEE